VIASGDVQVVAVVWPSAAVRVPAISHADPDDAGASSDANVDVAPPPIRSAASADLSQVYGEIVAPSTTVLFLAGTVVVERGAAAIVVVGATVDVVDDRAGPDVVGSGAAGPHAAAVSDMASPAAANTKVRVFIARDTAAGGGPPPSQPASRRGVGATTP